MYSYLLKSHQSLASHNQDIKISVIGADHKKRFIIDDNTYTLSEPTVFQGPGTYSLIKISYFECK